MSKENEKVVTGTYVKLSFSAFQNVFKAELEGEKTPGISDKAKKTQLLDFFKNAGINDALANEFIERSEKLSSKITNLCKPNSFGIPKNLNADEYKNLKADYDALMTLCSNINKSLSDKDFGKADNVFSKVQTALYADIHIVNELADKHPELPLELGFNNIKTRTISGSLSGAKYVSSNQNSRAIITIVDDYGNTRTGVYTPAKKVTDDMINHTEITTNGINVGTLKIQKGERIDSRNSAMYDVANLLGRPDLIAASMDVKYEHNGKIEEGNFMEFVTGTDLDHMTSDDPYFGINPGDYLSNNVKKDMLDLTIIDYLCLNVDRHGGNMIYQYAKDDKNVTRLTGIKGIDNDSSFGSQNPNFAKHMNRIQPITSTVLVTEEMAQKIKKMTKESLELIMRKYNMNEAAIQAAHKRLATLQGLLKNGAKITKGLRMLQRLRDKKVSGDVLSTKELENLNGLEDIFAGFEANPISYVQKNRSFNGNVDIQKFVPGLVVVPDKMLKSIDFDAMGQKTTLKSNDSSYTFHCGVIDVVTTEHNSQESIDINMKTARANNRKAKQSTSNPILRVGGENINGASRSLKLENDTLLSDLKRMMTSTKDIELQSVVDEMTKINTLSEKLGKEGYIATDMEVNVLVAYIQSVKDECSKCQTLLVNKVVDNNNRARHQESVLLTKISNTLDPMISRIRSAQERDSLLFNVDMIKKAEAIQTGRKTMLDEGFENPIIENVPVQTVKYSSIEEVAVASKIELIENIYKLIGIDGNPQNNDPELKDLVNATISFTNLKDLKDFPDALDRLEKSCVNYIAKHEEEASDELEQTCMNLAYDMKATCHKYEKVCKEVQQKEVDKELENMAPEANNLVM